MNAILRLIVLACSLSALATHAAETESFDTQVQSLKQQAIALNRDLFKLEEDLLFPSNTQISVFVSVDVGFYFSLDSVALKIDGKEVSAYLYTDREINALHQGGVQRLHMGNMKTGDHELVAVFTGKGPNNRQYKRGATVTINKAVGPKYIELKIVDQTGKQQPDFSIKEW
ncbi:MAG: AraC family transcriptional regulator [Gammaproteobacteria bacterium]